MWERSYRRCFWYDQGDERGVIDTTAYNYLLAKLCKDDRMYETLRVLDEMMGVGMHPDAITVEVDISSLYKLGKMDAVYQLLNQMKF